MSENPLGKTTIYPSAYEPALLFPVSRKQKRDEIGVGPQLPFVGDDVWTAYEISWLNLKGKPQVAIGEFRVPCTSVHITESKSLKLYLNSLNQFRCASSDELAEIIERDLSRAVDGQVQVRLFAVEDFQSKGFGSFEGDCLDGLDVECDVYSYRPELLALADERAEVSESLCTHLLKTNCLITSQPDWASLQVRYQGPRIDRESLLRYVVSFRNHDEFHEQCVERIFQDIMGRCRPTKLLVLARYTRRGGLDINPWRSNHPVELPFLRQGRQ